MTLALPAAVTFDEAAAVLGTLPQAVRDASGALRVDASALDRLDSAALALLLQARRLAAARGLGFELVGAPDRLLALARLYGVESLLGLPPAGSLAAGAAATA
jgi:phospholipid transport system transporter-binding protein